MSSETRIAIEEEGVPPLLKVRLPFSHRLNCFLRLWAFKIIAAVYFATHRFFNPSPVSLRPTAVKRYSCRPGLQTRVFFPPNHKPGKLLPLYLSIHGGAFVFGDPQHDDEFCVMWAKRTGMLVVSLDYHKAPIYPFPSGVYDVAAVANAVLEDDSLPIDGSRITIGGFSAGGNLALAAAQLPELKGIVKAALTFYPIVDWGHPPDEKMRRRPYKGGPRDGLEHSGWWFDWGYVPVGQNRHDPLLSPCYAPKEDLPPWIYIIGAEWDMLRLESQKMIYNLAGLDWTKEEDFEKGTYKWTLARGCSHAFTHHWGQPPVKKKRREAKCEPIYAQAAQWLEKALDLADPRSQEECENLSLQPESKPIVPAPTEAETKKRHELFANAFLVTKNLTNAFEYISSTYINHNPFAEDGPNAALDFLGPVWPRTQIRVLRTKFEGNQGWLNYEASGVGTVVDRFRWENGCIVEHWDVGEVYPESC
ncbi:Arylesterase [Paramyrothecium foliicola]|nr:Arylesterase [Paramyrothecium foliicola]